MRKNCKPYICHFGSCVILFFLNFKKIKKLFWWFSIVMILSPMQFEKSRKILIIDHVQHCMLAFYTLYIFKCYFVDVFIGFWLNYYALNTLLFAFFLLLVFILPISKSIVINTYLLSMDILIQYFTQTERRQRRNKFQFLHE